MVINDTLSERAFKYLKDEILTGNLKPGTKLRFEDLAEKLEVSQTPIKEALHMLELEGLVKMIPRKGAYVTRLTDQDLEEYTQIRLALECLAIDNICKKETQKDGINVLQKINREFEAAVRNRDAGECMKQDIRFHLAIATMSGNRRLIDLMAQLPLVNFWGHVGRQEIMVALGDTKVRDHDGLIEALASGKVEFAKAILRKNILSPKLESEAPAHDGV